MDCPCCGGIRLVRYGPAKANIACSECEFRWRADDLEDMHSAWLLGQQEPLTPTVLTAELEQDRADRRRR